MIESAASPPPAEDKFVQIVCHLKTNIMECQNVLEAKQKIYKLDLNVFEHIKQKRNSSFGIEMLVKLVCEH